ncbi:MAG: efflux RND transporter permease subunit, partial [Candidatus Binatia bacterium]
LVVRERLERNPQFLGVLAARDGTAAAIIADFDFTPPLSGYPEVKAAIDRVLADAQDGTFDTHLGGPAIYMAWLAHYSARMVFFFPLALVVIGLVHYEAFRTVQAIFLPLATAILAMLWSLGMLGMLGVPLDPFNVTTPILILAVAAGHAVQLLKRFYEENPHQVGCREAVVRSIGRVGPVMIVAGLIAALSFLSLLTFQTASIRNFGLLTALGILSALVIEMTFIPAVRSLLPTPSSHERAREGSRHFFDPATEAIGPWLGRGGWRPVLLVAAVAAALFGLAASGVEMDSTFRGQFFPSAVVRQDDDALNAAFGGTSTLVLLVEGDRDGASDEPRLLHAVQDLQRWFEEQPDVGETLSFVDFVERMHAAMNEEKPPASLPESRDLVAQYLLLYSLSGSVEDFDNLVDPGHRVCALRVFLKDDSTRAATLLVSRLEEKLRRTIPEGYRVRITGSLASSHALNEVMVHGKIRNILQIAAIILVVSSLVLRSVIGGLLVATPLAFAVVMTFGVMGMLGISLDIGTSTISAMAVGIGADYAIYLLFRLREELRRESDLVVAIDRTLRTSGKAVLFVSSAIAAGYLTLCFSGFGYHIRLGGLVAFAMVVSSLASLTVLPSLVIALRPAFLLDRGATAPAGARAEGSGASVARALAEGRRRSESRRP